MAFPAFDHGPHARGAMLKPLGEDLLRTAQQRLAIRLDRGGEPRARTDGLPKFGEALLFGGTDAEHGDSARTGQAQQFLDLSFETFGAAQVSFVNHHDVGHFQQAGFFPLQFVPGLGLNQNDDDIGECAHGRVALAGADRFE